MRRDRTGWVEQLADRYGQMIFATAYRVLGNADDAEEVLQEVFLKLLNRKFKSTTVRDWGAFLRVMSLRCAIDFLRRRAKQEQDTEKVMEKITASLNQNPRHIVEQRQKANLLRQALKTLPEREAKVFALRYFEEFSYEEIAKHLKLKVSQIGVILHRTRKRLREMLKPYLASDTREEDTNV